MSADVESSTAGWGGLATAASSCLRTEVARTRAPFTDVLAAARTHAGFATRFDIENQNDESQSPRGIRVEHELQITYPTLPLWSRGDSPDSRRYVNATLFFRVYFGGFALRLA